MKKMLVMFIILLIVGCTSGSKPVIKTQNNRSPTVEISNFAFSPSTINIKIGETIKWTNMDDTQHTVTFEEDAKNQESITLSKGEVYARDFPSSGTFTYYCSIHPSMKGTVIVE